MRAPLRLIAPTLMLAVLASAPPTGAHNNPSFREELLHTVDVSAGPLAENGAAHTEPFTLSPPKGSVELVWRVDSPARDAITFALARGGEVVASDLRDGAVSKLQRGDGFAIVDVAGAEAPFTVRVYANVIDRSRREGTAPPAG